MTDIQQVEGAAVDFGPAPTEEYDGRISRGFPALTLSDTAPKQAGYEWENYPPTGTTSAIVWPVYAASNVTGPYEPHVISTRILRAPYLANTRNEKSKARHRAVRRGLKGLFR